MCGGRPKTSAETRWKAPAASSPATARTSSWGGSVTLTSGLLDEGLVEDVLLFVYPVLLGQGKRFFSERVNPRELSLVSTRAMPSGLLMNTYRHVGALRTV